jgi:hypothetical protein
MIMSPPLSAAARFIPIQVEGEDAPRPEVTAMEGDGSVGLISFGDDAGRYDFVDIAMLGGVEYVALYRRSGEPADYVALVEALDDAADPPSPPDPPKPADPGSIGTIRGDTYVDAPPGVPV